MSVYNKKFYDNQEKGSINSAREILPNIIKILNPKSVIDVGCGIGTWLSVCMEFGLEDVLGLDGKWVDKKRLLIPKNKFIATDLENNFNINRKFDLVVSLEVAEHLSPEKSESFIKNLTSLAPAILFSAAIPFQGGTNHINEKWQEYWINLFKIHDYHAIDCIRGEIWDNEKIEWWYRQNIFLFIEKNNIDILNQTLKDNFIHPVSIVHPKLYSNKIKKIKLLNEKLNLKTKKHKKMLDLQAKNHDYEIIEYTKLFSIQAKDFKLELSSKIEEYEYILEDQVKSYNELDAQNRDYKEDIVELKNDLLYSQETIKCLQKKQKENLNKLEEYLELLDVQRKNFNCEIFEYNKLFSIQAKDFKLELSSKIEEYEYILEDQVKSYNELDAQNRDYEEDIVELKNDLLYSQETIKCLQKKQNAKISKIEYLEKNLMDIKCQIEIIANTRPYRFAYFLRRFSHEFLKGDKKSKKDFITWLFCKFRKKNCGVKFRYNPLIKIAKK